MNISLYKYIRKFIITIVILCLYLGHIGYVSADTLNVRLFRDTAGNLRFDTFVANPIEYMIGDFVDIQQVRNQYTSQSGVQLISSNTNIDPIFIPVNPNSTGAFSITVPYYDHIISLQVVNNRKIIDTVMVKEYSKCNSNAICEYEKGENENTCIADCIGDSVGYSAETLNTLSQNNGIIRDESGTVLLQNQNSTSSEDDTNSTEPEDGGNLLILLLGFLFLGGGIGFFVWKTLRR